MNKSERWETLRRHQREIDPLHLRALFAEDPERARRFSLTIDELVIDFSKNRITEETLAQLLALARASHVEQKIAALVSGEKVNATEGRPALHTALRRPAAKPLLRQGEDVNALVQAELARIAEFIAAVEAGEIKGASGKPFRTLINIGIGGSDLGPRLAVDALREYRRSDLIIRFVANLDAKDLYRALEDADPETTLFILASKSFATQETLQNADTAISWLTRHGCRQATAHLVGVTANPQAARAYGILETRIFRFWDWVGGRYSIWSAVGLPLALSVGMEGFREFLHGAHIMDEHFQNAELELKAPVILALLGIWYNNFFDAQTQAIVPYDAGLALLPEYLGQLVMESNGKGVTHDGRPCPRPSAPVLWGSVGTNAQHAFFQLLHQGRRLIPVDFLLPQQSALDETHHKKLVANCLAQSKALMCGRDNAAAPHRHFPGNQPSNTILYERLSPKVLGMLLALYEHKTFVEAAIWDINPFDQWGVELGKELAQEILGDLDHGGPASAGHDASTRFLIERCKQA